MNNQRRQLIVTVIGCCVALAGMSFRLIVLDHRSHTLIWWLTTFGDPAQRGWDHLQQRVAVLSQVYAGDTTPHATRHTKAFDFM